MVYQTDSDGNFFVNSSLDDTGSNFVTDLPDCLTAALGASNYAVIMPSSASAANLSNFRNLRLEWRPQGVGETLTGTITLNTPGGDLYYNDSNTGSSNYVLSANARFGIQPFDTGPSYYAFSTPMRGNSGQYLNVPSPFLVAAGAPARARVYATITRQEVIFFVALADFSQYFLGYQGVVQNISSTFSGQFPKGSVGFCMGNGSQIGGISVWTDNTVRRLRFASHALNCTTASGQTFGTNLWMTDFPFMFDASANNNPIIGTAKNLKLAIGTSVTLGSIYQPSTPIDGGSNLWLCIGNHPSFTNGRIMMRIIT